MNHAGITSGCAACHDGSHAPARSKTDAVPTHVVTSQPCEVCHKSTVSFKTATFNHVGITSGCATCHDGVKAKGKAAYPKHIATTQDCSVCHTPANTNNFVAFGPGTPMNHAGITSGCATCHNGTNALGKSSYAPHITTTAACETCHAATNFTAWGPGTKMNHTGITSGCAACHDGAHAPALGKASFANHVTTAAPCETCHSKTNFTTWSGTKMNHTGITTGCATCHIGAGLSPKGLASFPAHITTTKACETCHTPTNYTAWGPGTKMNHTGILTGCATCHDGAHTPAKGMTGSALYPAHVTPKAGQGCEFCHTPTNYTAWGPGTLMNHTGITSGCAACHDNDDRQGQGGGRSAARGDDAGVRELSQEHDLVQIGDLQSRGHHFGLRGLPRWRQGEGQVRLRGSHSDDPGLFGLPHARQHQQFPGLWAGHADEPHRHHDRLRRLPQRHQRARQGLVSATHHDDGCLRDVPYPNQFHGVGAGHEDEPHRHHLGVCHLP